MKRLLLIALLLLAAPAWAEEPFNLARMSGPMLGAGVSAAAGPAKMKQKLISGFSAALSATNARYIAPSSNPLMTGTVNYTAQTVPTAGTVRKLRVLLSAQPDAENDTGKYYVATVQRGAGANAPSDTAITCTIAGSAWGCEDVTHEVTDISADDRIVIKITPTGTPAAAMVSTQLEFESDSANEAIMMASFGDTALSTTTRYITPQGGVNSATEFIGSSVMPCAGTISKFYARTVTAAGDGNTRTLKLFKNGVDTESGQLDFNASDLVKSSSPSVAVVAGDRISIEYSGTGSAAATNGSMGLVLNPTTNGEFPIVNVAFSLTAGNTRYMSVGQGYTVPATSETLFALGDDDFSVTGATTICSIASGSDKSIVSTLRTDAPADASPNFEITITNSTSASSVTGTLTPSAFTPPSTYESYGIEHISPSGANTVYLLWSAKGYIAP